MIVDVRHSKARFISSRSVADVLTDVPQVTLGRSEATPPAARQQLLRTSSGGGLAFSFLWFPPDHEPDVTWHTVFRSALAFIRQGEKTHEGCLPCDPVQYFAA